MPLILLLLAGLTAPPERPPRSDETILFFDSAAVLDPAGERWVIPIHFWAFEPERDSLTRKATIDLLAKTLDVDDKPRAQRRMFEQRAAWFLVDNEEHVRPRIRIGGAEHLLNASGENGHSMTLLHVPRAALPAPRGGVPAWARYQLLDAHGQPTGVAAGALLIPPEGVSVISDIDDTIRITHVRDTGATFRSTFLNQFQPVPGMSDVYADWAKRGAAFHYASSSPWQLYTPIVSFMEKEGFPRGGMHMKLVRLKDSSFFNLFKSPRELKGAQVERVLQTWPGRRFILVGDSAEQDPEIYGDLARRYADRVARVYIRNLDGQTPEASRYREAFRELPPERWRLFTDPGELRADAAVLFDDPAASAPASR